MPSTFRIPRATISGPYGRLMSAYARRTWGQVPDNALVLWHHRGVFRAVIAFERRVASWDRLDKDLRAYAVLASAGVVGCSWCLDFGYFVSRHEGVDPVKLGQVQGWQESAVFSDLERDVIAYAEAMSATPMTVTDELTGRLLHELGPGAVVELTQLVALENMRSRFNGAAGLESQGFYATCDLPSVVGSAP